MTTDTQLKNDILAELDWDPAVRSTDVGVIVKDGVVTLTGHPASYAEKYAIERAAERVMGVRAIAVEMTVRLPAMHERTDADIAMAVERALEWNVLVPQGKVHPVVEGGWVTLRGEVEWEYQRRAAGAAVRDLLGVKGVSNTIGVKPRVAPSDVERKIRDALERQADRDARQIQVSVAGDYVTLSGKVRSWAELDSAEGAAWSAPGVACVINRMSVEP
ncbi:MAG: BON domain-containing protein [Gammaproteobacteria bacterium]|nr:BON domain-containing protein [Gammaproteobacteria bacterium]MBU1439854.1 BON domain-containing protein [Gammaproteobacteria bacterium]MBU2285723.1 BON domain-containing protein [Gammaproteobacteria bacterium]MBU2408827.1 BON domain-containing protein [Gammaproteobacteria bacterium]